MKINLSEIPTDGKSFVWTDKTGELKEPLRDFIQNLAYTADFVVKPLNSKDFELRGKIQTFAPEECSRCCLEFNLPINESFYEILIPRQENPRNSKYAKTNHVSDSVVDADSPSVSEYDHLKFDMGEYLHEIVGLAIPFNPVGPEDGTGKCTICQKMVKGCAFSYDEPMESVQKQNPFEVLKNLKVP